MVNLRTLYFPNVDQLIDGMRKAFRLGLRPRALLFMAFDELGAVYVAHAEREVDVSTITVGEKLTLTWPFDRALFYVDAIHLLGSGVLVVNGDRRLRQVATLFDLVAMVSEFIKRGASHASSAARMGFQQRVSNDSIFFGCTAHQPGSWWLADDRNVIPAHTNGYVEIVPAPRGLLSRRTSETTLYYLPGQQAVSGGRTGWQPVFKSGLGKILMVERRALGGRLFLSCERGLIELDVTDLPQVHELGRVELSGGYGVVGRISHGAFSVTRGTPCEWGLDNIQPATLIGTKDGSLPELSQALQSL